MDCLFCESSGPFSTKEHIIPESLGNTDDVLIGVVCDKCQNYFAHSVEKPALEKTPIGFWRTILGITTKKKKLPTFESSPPNGGKISASHPSTDIFKLEALEDGSSALSDGDPSKMTFLSDDPIRNLKIVLSPWHILILGRFLGKIGIELVASISYSDAMQSSFDALRNYVRYGSTNFVWPVYIGKHGVINELRDWNVSSESTFAEMTTECYRFSLGARENGGMVFAFRIGTDLYVLDLTSHIPDQELTSVIENTTMTCLYYSPDEIRLAWHG